MNIKLFVSFAAESDLRTELSSKRDLSIGYKFVYLSRLHFQIVAGKISNTKRNHEPVLDET